MERFKIAAPNAGGSYDLEILSVLSAAEWPWVPASHIMSDAIKRRHLVDKKHPRKEDVVLFPIIYKMAEAVAQEKLKPLPDHTTEVQQNHHAQEIEAEAIRLFNQGLDQLRADRKRGASDSRALSRAKICNGSKTTSTMLSKKREAM